MKTKNYKYIKEWKRDAYTLLRNMFPAQKIPSSAIDEYLDKVIEDNIKKTELKLFNNYTGKTYASDTLDLTEFYYKVKPIVTESGTLFDADAPNPAAQFLLDCRENRVGYKNEAKKHPPKSFMYSLFDLFQSLEKVKMNAWYGVSGAPTAIFYNLFCAESVTGKGRTLISTATLAFENFLANNVAFMDMNECLVFVKNVLQEKSDRKFKDSYIGIKDISVYKVKERLLSKTISYNEQEYAVLCRLLNNLDQEDLNRLYYKNNLYKFFSLKNISNTLKSIMGKVDSFTNPNEVPEIIKYDLIELWEITREYVFYNYPIYKRVKRTEKLSRKSVVVIDTDSWNWEHCVVTCNENLVNCWNILIA